MRAIALTCLKRQCLPSYTKLSGEKKKVPYDSFVTFMRSFKSPVELIISYQVPHPHSTQYAIICEYLVYIVLIYQISKDTVYKSGYLDKLVYLSAYDIKSHQQHIIFVIMHFLFTTQKLYIILLLLVSFMPDSLPILYQSE